MANEIKVSVNGKQLGIPAALEEVVNYQKVTNKPKINGVELVGDKTTKELGIDVDTSKLATKDELSNKADKAEIPTKTSELENDSGYLKNQTSIENSLAIDLNNIAGTVQGTQNVFLGAIRDTQHTATANAVVVGANARAGTGSVAIGQNVSAHTLKSTSIGKNTYASADGGTVLGADAHTTANATNGTAVGIGAISDAECAIQIGQGTNNKANTMNVGLGDALNVQLLDSTGIIPSERIPDLDYLKNTGVGTGSVAVDTNNFAETMTGERNVVFGSYKTNLQQTGVTGSTCVGYNVKAGSSSVSIGSEAKSYNQCVSIGCYSLTEAAGGTAVGRDATCTANASYGTALGRAAKSDAANAIQIGRGTNSAANTLSVGLSDSLNVQLLDAEGKIPGERMSLQGTTAPDTTTVGSIGQFYVDTASGTGYMCVGVSGSTYTWKQITA